MSELFYNTASRFSKIFGIWFFKVSSWFVATGFFFMFPHRVQAGLVFYHALYPERNWIWHLLCVWKQYHNFTSVFIDRFRLMESGYIPYSAFGWEYIENALNAKKGGIILMSHLGNWEIAAHLLKEKRPDIPVLLYMGIKEKEEIEKIQKESLRQKGVSIIAVDRNGGSPFDIIDGIKNLENGGLVSLTGDMIWTGKQRSIEVKFLNHKIMVPETPYVLALMSGSPVFVFFAFRKKDGSYFLKATPPIYVESADRNKRDKAIKEAAQKYALALEQAVMGHPFEWYHFTPFLK